MVWTYHEVKKLRKKHAEGGEISTSEVRSLEKYVHHKEKVAHLGDHWSQKQLLRAEELLHDLKKQETPVAEVTEK
jgi:hypothetical protein